MIQTDKEQYKLPHWMHKYANMIGNGATVEGIEWYMNLEDHTEISKNIQIQYRAKIELLKSLHKAHLI